MLSWLISIFRRDRNEAAFEEAWRLRAAEAEQLTFLGYREWLADPMAVYPLRERELEFRRRGRPESFVAKPVYLGDEFNVADLWWRLPELIPPSQKLH
jgi:hypothetical protein